MPDVTPESLRALSDAYWPLDPANQNKTRSLLRAAADEIEALNSLLVEAMRVVGRAYPFVVRHVWHALPNDDAKAHAKRVQDEAIAVTERYLARKRALNAQCVGTAEDGSGSAREASEAAAAEEPTP